MNALLFILRLMGVTIVDADGSSEIAFEARDPKIQEGSLVRSELAKAREDGPYCVIIDTEAGSDSLNPAVLNKFYGDEKCSSSLQSS